MGRALRKPVFIFLLFGLAGFVMEILVLRVTQQTWMPRGYWFTPEHFPLGFMRDGGIPLIPLYGAGGLVMYYLIGRLKRGPAWVFMGGAMILTLLELLASYVGEWLVGYRFWVYFPPFAYFGNRLDVMSTLAWGGLSLLFVYVVMQPLERLYQRTVGRRWVSVLLAVAAGLTILCMLHQDFKVF
jgi:uncharacterized membrane protein